MNLNQKPPKREKRRAFDVGHMQGSLEVVELIGDGPRDTHPETGKRRSRSVFWYLVECDCREVEIMNQDQLMGGKAMCTSCEREKRLKPPKPRKPAEPLPEEVANALRGRW